MSNKRIFLVSAGILLALFLTSFVEIFYYPDSVVLNFIESIFAGVLFYIFIKKHQQTTDSCAKISINNAYPVIFSFLSAYRFIYFYMENITRIPFIFAFCLIAAFILAFILLYHLLKFVLKNECISLIYSLAIMLLFNVNFDNSSLMQSYIGSLLFIVILFLLLKNKTKFISFLKIFSFVLLSVCLFGGFYNYIINSGLIFNNKNINKIDNKYGITKIPERDIYIFLLDMYAGKRGLEYIGFDNSDFVKKLQQRGFTVYENMESNYSRTVISISSFLNADYIENIPYEAPQDAASNSKMFEIAKQTGYKIYYINSWPVDFNIKKGIIDEAYNVSRGVNADMLELFIGKTILAPVVAKLNIADDADKFQAVLKYANDTINRKDKKQLVFIHFLMPHMPYIYDENGNKNLFENYMDTKGKGNEYILNNTCYTGFLKYANKTMLKFIDEIFNKKKEKPVIIIMGDHGLRPVDYTVDSKNHMDEVQKNYKYYFNTFLAYYNPDLQPEFYMHTESLVNFSINFLNEIFGTKIKNLEDKHFYVFPPYTSLFKLQSIRAVY